MSLAIYESADPTTDFSADGDMTNPIRQSFDGRVGGVKEIKYYVRNDNVSNTYTDIVVTPVDRNSPTTNFVDGTNGYSWKLKVGNTQPLAEEWDTIADGNTISFDNISDTVTYLPFWVRIEVPLSAPVDSFDSVVLRLTASES